jgi:hypothetical protein
MRPLPKVREESSPNHRFITAKPQKAPFWVVTRFLYIKIDESLALGFGSVRAL